MTRQQFLSRSGIDPGHLSRIEKGDYHSSTNDTTRKLAQGLGVSVDELNRRLYGGSEVRPISFDEAYQAVLTTKPITIRVYDWEAFPFQPNNSVEPIRLIYRAPDQPVLKRGEGYVIRGTSLPPLIREGDTIVIDRDGIIENHDIVVCSSNGSVTLAKVRMVSSQAWVERKDCRMKIEECRDTSLVVEVIRGLK